MAGPRADGFLIMAAGTGGHVYPALAVAERLRAGGARVEWLGTGAGVEARVVPAAGFELHRSRVSGLRGKGPRRWLAAPFALVAALAEAWLVLRRLRPAVVLGMGGYGSGPGGIAAWVSRTPLVIHEQNSVPGLTNRLLAPLAARVLEAFPGSFAPERAAVHVGNPVRAAIAGLAAPASRLSARHGPLRLLVLGGSQGAAAINATVPDAIARVGTPVEVRHQAGPRHVDATRDAYRAAGTEAQVAGFIDDMASAYAWADVVVCRAGAMTLAELAGAGIGSILVPYPHAVDDHQTVNARRFAERGAAELVPQDELDAGRLARLLAELAADRPRLLAMAQAARAMAVPDAAERVARACREVADADV